MTFGQGVGLAATVVFAAAVALLGLVAVKLGRLLGETQKTVAKLTDETIPLLQEVTSSVTHVNDQLVRVDAITGNVETITTNAKALSGLFAATLGSPLVKVAAFSYGVRKAAAKRQEADVRKRVKAEIKDEKAAIKAEKKASKKSGRSWEDKA